MRLPTLSARSLATLSLATLGLSALVTCGAATLSPASAATCTDVEVDFARGSTEAPGTGIVGTPFISALTSALPGRTVSSYAVVYAADIAQTSAAAGTTDLVNHLNNVAASCPNTRFVLGGYSQGATLVDKAIGIATATGGVGGSTIPATLAPKVAAIVVFGNPLGLQASTIAKSSPIYGARSKDYCASGDPVCGGGANVAAHLTYGADGSTTSGAQFAAGLVNSGTTPGTTTPPPASTTCVTDSTSAHVSAGRAVNVFNTAYARGSYNRLGAVNTTTRVTLKQTGTSTWTLVSGC